MVSEVEQVADSTAERCTVAAVASMAAQLTVVEVHSTVAAVMVAEATGRI